MYRISCVACFALVGIWLVGCEDEHGAAGIERAKEAVGQAPAPEAKPAAKAEKPAASEAPAQTTDEAKSLLDQANSAIQDGKLDQAQAAVDKLQGMKSSLPEAMQKKVDALTQSLDKAKAAKTDPTSLIPKKTPAKK